MRQTAGGDVGTMATAGTTYDHVLTACLNYSAWLSTLILNGFGVPSFVSGLTTFRFSPIFRAKAHQNHPLPDLNRKVWEAEAI